MELHQLRYLVAVAELGSFTRAAEHCLVAQPSLSQQIIKLEKELGQPLFERLGRKVQLTDAGRALYTQAVQILDLVDNARRQVSEAGQGGRVAVGAIPTVAPYLLPRLLERFLRRYPEIDLTIQENYTEHTVRGCLEGELDLGILALPVEDERLEVEPLFTEELLLALSPEHPLAKRRRISMQDVLEYPFILLDETHCLGEQIVSFCKQQSCMPVISCRSAQLLTVQELVASGHGLSLVPAMAARLDKSRRRVYRSLVHPRPKRTLGLIWHRSRYQTPLVQKFIQAIREEAREREQAASLERNAST